MTVIDRFLKSDDLNKSLVEMNLIELDIAIINILNNEHFIKKNSIIITKIILAQKDNCDTLATVFIPLKHIIKLVTKTKAPIKK